jgi:hypothetical protein
MVVPVPDAPPVREKRPRRGPVFTMRRFGKPSAEGVAYGCQLTGYWDFPTGGFRCWIERGVQKVAILKEAAHNGDAGIERHFWVTPGDAYRLTASVRVAEKTGAFKARINLSARRADHSQVAEFNDRQTKVTAEPVERTIEATIPVGATYLSARVKFHTDEPGESGVGEIHTMKLERIG